MFDRLGRLFRAWMGFFISMGEDPEVMLEDAIEEMRITMPKLNSVLVAKRQRKASPSRATTGT